MPTTGEIRESGEMVKISEFYKSMSGKYQGIFDVDKHPVLLKLSGEIREFVSPI